MNVLRVTPPGNTLAKWVPSWDNDTSSQSLSVECLTHENNWMDDVQQYIATHPHTVIQYEGIRDRLPNLPPETLVIWVIRHLTAIPRKKTHVSHFVVPSYYAREILRRKGYRAVTIQPVAEKTDVMNKAKLPAAPLTILLHPGTTTKRLLQSIRTLNGRRYDIEWLLIDDGRHRVQTIVRAFKQMKHHVRSVKAGETGIWRQADVMVTDQHPVYSLHALHIRVIAHGIPILTTAVGDHPESVKHWHNGFLLSPRQLASDLSYYLKQLIQEPGLIRQLRVNGCSLCEKFHSNDRVLPDWLTLYQLVERGRQR